MPIPVIPIDNTAFDTRRMELPVRRRGLDFALDFKSFVQDRGQFDNFVRLLDELTGPAIVLQDLALEIELTEAEERELDLALDMSALKVTAKENFSPEQSSGLYLALRALRNTNWQGVLEIASANVNAAYRRVLQKHLGQLKFAPRVTLAFADDLSGNTLETTKEAIDAFCRGIEQNPADDPTWFLFPPGSEESHPNITWFDLSVAAHSSGERFDAHRKAIRERFARWHSEASAKALVHSVGPSFMPKSKRYLVKAECLRDFFGEPMQLVDLEAQTQFLLPVQPAFPFLCALRRLFAGVGGEWQKCVQLCRLDDRHVAVLLQTPSNGWHIVARRAWKKERAGDTSIAFIQALRAEVDHATADPSPHLAPLLRGTDTEAFPWIHSTHIGVAWETLIKS